MGRKKLIFGVGVNDADYPVNCSKRGLCPFYFRWRDALRRCYCPLYKDRFPSYEGCYFCDEWLVFSNFKKWMEKQDWKGKQLDKDLVVLGNKIYSPDTCIFISGSLNSFFTLREGDRGSLPLGVTIHPNGHGKYYRAHISEKGKKRSWGKFSNPQDCHTAWLAEKIRILKAHIVENPDIAHHLKNLLIVLEYHELSKVEFKGFKGDKND